MISANDIVTAALEAGYHRCGVIPVERMAGYEARLEERMARFPETRRRYEGFRAFAHLRDSYPWARSVVVCAFWYGKYRIPEAVKGKIAKYYLVDSRRDAASEGYRASVGFEAFLREAGLRVETDRDFGLTALRWAAMQAGLGVIRKNNFFYSDKGSWEALEAFLIDRPLEHIDTPAVKRCPEKCDLCMRACPTKSLDAPYSMCRNTCVSCLTTWDGWDLRVEPLRDRFGQWMYGCDACQDACPFNRNAWTEDEDFPGLEALSHRLSYEAVTRADYKWLRDVLQPKLWYIPEDKIWRYKTNALNAMLNNYRPEYLPVIREACDDEYPQVREMAEWVLGKAEIGNRH